MLLVLKSQGISNSVNHILKGGSKLFKSSLFKFRFKL